MRRRGARVLLAGSGLLLLAAVSGLAGGPAVAQTDSDKQRVDEQIKSVQGQVAEVSAEEGRLYNLLAESSARKAELDAKVAGIDGQIRGVQGRLNAAESRLAAIEADQRRTEARLAEATGELTKAKSELARQAIAAYTGQSEAARYATMLLGSESVGDLASRRSYLKAVVGSQSEAILVQEKLRDEVKDLGDSLRASQAEADGQRATVAAERAKLQGPATSRRRCAARWRPRSPSATASTTRPRAARRSSRTSWRTSRASRRRSPRPSEPGPRNGRARRPRPLTVELPRAPTPLPPSRRGTAR